MEQMYLSLLERNLRRIRKESVCECRIPDYSVKIKICEGTHRSIITVCGGSVRTPAFRLADCIKRQREKVLDMPVFIRVSQDICSPVSLEDRLFIRESELLALLAGCTADGFNEFFGLRCFGCG